MPQFPVPGFNKKEHPKFDEQIATNEDGSLYKEYNVAGTSVIRPTLCVLLLDGTEVDSSLLTDVFSVKEDKIELRICPGVLPIGTCKLFVRVTVWDIDNGHSYINFNNIIKVLESPFHVASRYDV